MLPNGLEVNCTTHERGPVSDIKLLRNIMDINRSALTKTQSQKSLDHHGILVEEYRTTGVRCSKKNTRGFRENFML